mmetsp:Transcript_44697/g.145235  ORF Transcript_44697/g.145235 Transcript_44697/m.145235 type:complete len:264 (-) Transcript_44697:2222-3013(-)
MSHVGSCSSGFEQRAPALPAGQPPPWPAAHSASFSAIAEATSAARARGVPSSSRMSSERETPVWAVQRLTSSPAASESIPASSRGESSSRVRPSPPHSSRSSASSEPSPSRSRSTALAPRRPHGPTAGPRAAEPPADAKFHSTGGSVCGLGQCCCGGVSAPEEPPPPDAEEEDQQLVSVASVSSRRVSASSPLPERASHMMFSSTNRITSALRASSSGEPTALLRSGVPSGRPTCWAAKAARREPSPSAAPDVTRVRGKRRRK